MYGIVFVVGGDIGDVGLEGVVDIGDFFVDGIGYLVGDIVYGGVVGGYCQVEQMFVFGYVIQFVFDVVGIGVGVYDVFDYDVVLFQCVLGGELDFVVVGWFFDDLCVRQGVELVGMVQVGVDYGSDIGGWCGGGVLVGYWYYCDWCG